MRWPWQRRVEEGTGGTSPAPSAPSAARGRTADEAGTAVSAAGWAFLPPLQRVIAPESPSTHRHDLASWRSPALTGTLSHAVSSAAPAGVIDADGRGVGGPSERAPATAMPLLAPMPALGSLPPKAQRSSWAAVQRAALPVARVVPSARPATAPLLSAPDAPMPLVRAAVVADEDPPVAPADPPVATPDSAAPPDISAAPPDDSAAPPDDSAAPPDDSAAPSAERVFVNRLSSDDVPPVAPTHASAPLLTSGAAVPARVGDAVTGSGVVTGFDIATGAGIVTGADNGGATYVPVPRPLAPPASTANSAVNATAEAASSASPRLGLGAPLPSGSTATPVQRTASGQAPILAVRRAGRTPAADALARAAGAVPVPVQRLGEPFTSGGVAGRNAARGLAAGSEVSIAPPTESKVSGAPAVPAPDAVPVGEAVRPEPPAAVPAAALELPRATAGSVQRRVGLLGERPLRLQLGAAAAPGAHSSGAPSVQRATSTAGARPPAAAIARSARSSPTPGPLGALPAATRIELLPPEVAAPVHGDRFATITGYEQRPALAASFGQPVQRSAGDPSTAGNPVAAMQRAAAGPALTDPTRPATTSSSTTSSPTTLIPTATTSTASAPPAPLAAASSAPMPMPVASVQRADAPVVGNDVESTERTGAPAPDSAVAPSARPVATLSAAGAPAAVDAGAPHPTELDQTELDKLAGQLLGPLTRRIKAEMVIDRERRGLRSDPR